MNEQLASLLAEVFGMRAEEIQLDLNQDDVGTWDSLKQMDLVMSLEREYHITLDIPDIVRMTNVSEIMSVLESKGVNLGN